MNAAFFVKPCGTGHILDQFLKFLSSGREIQVVFLAQKDQIAVDSAEGKVGVGLHQAGQEFFLTGGQGSVGQREGENRIVTGKGILPELPDFPPGQWNFRIPEGKTAQKKQRGKIHGGAVGKDAVGTVLLKLLSLLLKNFIKRLSFCLFP